MFSKLYDRFLLVFSIIAVTPLDGRPFVLERVEHVERVVIPAMWSPRFRLVVQPRKANPSVRHRAQEP